VRCFTPHATTAAPSASARTRSKGACRARVCLHARIHSFTGDGSAHKAKHLGGRASERHTVCHTHTRARQNYAHSTAPPPPVGERWLLRAATQFQSLTWLTPGRQTPLSFIPSLSRVTALSELLALVGDQPGIYVGSPPPPSPPLGLTTKKIYPPNSVRRRDARFFNHPRKPPLAPLQASLVIAILASLPYLLPNLKASISSTFGTRHIAYRTHTAAGIEAGIPGLAENNSMSIYSVVEP
jgi:hypothetical protein